MRRLVFNPLAQQPYASGEYDNSVYAFVLDKNIELGHVYIAQVYNATVKELSTTIIDFTRPMTSTNATLSLTDVNFDISTFNLFYSKGNPNYLSLGGNAEINATHTIIIYLYKVF